MDFKDIVTLRQSCRNYDGKRTVEREKLDFITEAARLAPSACNSQPYFITVCEGNKARAVAKATQGMGMNRFTDNAPVMIVISEEAYSTTAALGAKVKKNDYRSIDIGILAAYITSAATEVGLSTCILGWFDDGKLREICSLDAPVRLVISLGYAAEEDTLRRKLRKDREKLIKYEV